MKYNILTLPEFDKAFKMMLKKYPSIKKDISDFKTGLLNGKNLGVDLGGNIRKVRMQIESKGTGKRGGARIITYTMFLSVESKNIILVTMYEKGKQESIPIKEIKAILKSEGLIK